MHRCNLQRIAAVRNCARLPMADKHTERFSHDSNLIIFCPAVLRNCAEQGRAGVRSNGVA
jgi:hypothetical protein